MYDSRYMSHIVGSRKRSIFFTSFLSSSADHVNSPEVTITSPCLLIVMALVSEGVQDAGVDDVTTERV